MTISHRPVAGATSATSPSETQSQQRRTLRATPTPARRPLKASGLTRRYALTWLDPETGFIEDEVRIAPAIPLFEEAFSAFARGAVVATTEGPVAIEDLVPGMQALTAEGTTETITWIGSMTVFPGQAEDGGRLIRVTAEAFGAARPLPDLVLGPRARICLSDARLRGRLGIESAYAPVAGFLDGVSVIEVSPISPVTVYHLVLENQGSLRVGGLEVESFHPGEGAERMLDPRMAELFAGIFPQIRFLRDFGRLRHPRLTRFEVEEMLG